MLQIRRECKDFSENMESIVNASEEWKESDYHSSKLPKLSFHCHNRKSILKKMLPIVKDWRLPLGIHWLNINQ
jgi:hypothetical protein